MSYRRAEEILPMEIIELIQQYVDGENIYIPKKEGKRLGWGVQSGARQEIVSRDERIYREYQSGIPTVELAETYFLSVKSIQRIVRLKKQAV